MQVIGPIYDIETELQCVLSEYELQHFTISFSTSALSCLPFDSEICITEHELSYRRDLRNDQKR